MKRLNLNIHHLPLGIFLLGILSCFGAAIISSNYWNFLGLLIMISLASMLIGTFFGFLFGIPKLNKNYNPSENYGKTNKYNPNTNLEDISDWLTKIIVGISLTQLTKIPGYIDSIANSILSKNACAFICDYARPVIISDIIYFVISGFIIGYFYTRLYIPNLLSIMEENKKQDAEIKIWRESKTKENLKPQGESTSKLSEYTDDEINMLRKIKKENNKFIERGSLSNEEFAAVRVLLTKGIIAITQGGTFRNGSTLSIVNEDVLNALTD